jgi:hypothetical protein
VSIDATTVRVGDELPSLVIEVTATVIAAGAIASRDFIPASSSIFVPSAASNTGKGDEPCTSMPTWPLNVSPANDAVPDCTMGSRISRYSRM